MSTVSMTSAAARRKSTADLARYADWHPERDDLSYHVPERTSARDRLQAGDRRISRDDLAAVLSVELGGGLRAERRAHEIIAVLHYVSTRARGCDPHAAPKDTIARWVAEGERLRALNSPTTAAEKRWGHTDEARRRMLARSERRIEQLKRGGTKTHRALKRWITDLLDQVVGLGLVEGMWAVGRYAKSAVRAAVESSGRYGAKVVTGFVMSAGWGEQCLGKVARNLFDERSERPSSSAKAPTAKTTPPPRETAKTKPIFRGPAVKTTPKRPTTHTGFSEDLRSSAPVAAPPLASLADGVGGDRRGSVAPRGSSGRRSDKRTEPDWVLQLTPAEVQAAVGEGYLHAEDHPPGTKVIVVEGVLASIILEDCGGMRLT